MSDKATRLDKLKTELADIAARCDIESYCRWAMRNRHRWYDTAGLEGEEADFVARAVEYLDLRGKLEHNATEPNLVMMKP